jgi:hypothetical protein
LSMMKGDARWGVFDRLVERGVKASMLDLSEVLSLVVV